jgi:hypothetical protein
MDRGTKVEELVWHLRQGLLDVDLDDSLGSTDDKLSLIREEALRNLLVAFNEQLLFLVHDKPSLDLRYGSDDQARVTGLLKELRRHAPRARAVFIASDWHHHAWLKEMGLAQ